jgi:monoamine oxidase
MPHDLIIVGAGLAGLALARTMTSRGKDVMVLEALPRIGGRVLSHRTAAGCYDLGPAWVWPTLQPRIAQLVEALGLDLYAQAEAGGFIYQDAQGNVQRLANGFPQEPPSMRVHGGIEALIEAIGAECRSDTIRLQTRVRGISVHQDGVDVTADGPEGPIGLRARRVVLALPPRLVGGIDLSPTLPAAVWNRLHEVPTWMGGHAKALAIYARPHWREASLSGSAISRCGPLSEIHDASLPAASEAALFGFFGWDARQRERHRATLKEQVVAQLQRLFSHNAGAPREVVIQDWAFEPLTSTTADGVVGDAHPDYRPISLPEPWNNRLLLSASEAAPEFAGYLEGAVASAEAAAAWALR